LFTDRTICAELPGNLNETEKKNILRVRSKLKNFIDESLNPHNPNYISDISIPEILDFLVISEDEYYRALSISSVL